MVEGKSLVAGILGIVCAIAVLGFMGLPQAGPIAGPALANQAAVTSSAQTQSRQSVVPGPSYSANPQGAQIPNPSSAQSIESPNAIFGAAFLGAISLAISLCAAFLVSRRGT
ncbi:MAG: hypothetical protein PXY39_04965 [archaeon]|jgi:hypothetical protein|nr:hypothetical protein [archaeon]